MFDWVSLRNNNTDLSSGSSLCKNNFKEIPKKMKEAPWEPEFLDNIFKAKYNYIGILLCLIVYHNIKK